MDLISSFNNLNGKTVKRSFLKSLLTRAKKQRHSIIASRISKVLQQNNDTLFAIELTQLIEPAGLSGAEQKIILPTLEYISEEDSEGGLNGVSPDDIYSYITDLIINTIDKVGHLPWQKDWVGSGSDGAAKNYLSKKEYTGANFLLNFDVKFDEEGKGYLVPIKFIQPYYLTFNQIRETKASLKKDSKARRVIYYTMIFNYDNGTLKFKTTDKAKFTEFVKSHGLTKEDLKAHLVKIPVIKYYNVFRADDCTGLKFPEATGNKNVNPIEQAQSLIDGYKDPPTYTFIGDRAYYQPSTDKLNMPNIKAFKKEASYYCTYFHELTHSTGAKKRLNRDMTGTFGSKPYAFEELIAELGAVFMCSESGILFQTKENSAKYLKNWNTVLVSELENDNRFFLKASAQSQKAVNYILGRNSDSLKEEEEEKKEEPVKKVAVKIPVKRTPKSKFKSKTKQGEQLDLFVGLGAKAKTKKTTEVKKKRLVKVPGKTTTGVSEKTFAKDRNKSLNQLEKLGFVSANSAPKEAKDVFVLGGEIGKFLQKQQPHKALILIKGNKHSSKSQLAMQIANAFGEQQTPVAYIDYEQGGIESKDTLDSINRNTSEKGRGYIAIKGYLEKPFQELQDFCKVVKVIIADSVTDLKITADQLNFLRTTYPKVIWCFISQVKENGAMYGGNKMAHNPTSVIHCSSNQDPKQRFATLEKNRGNDLTFIYSMYYKKVVSEPTEQKSKRKLSFKVK
ncbi:zincin-like metallopeptidase domain-containing protein [Flavobacterium amniphilum]|uniref:ArdC family protein n=1 Tax=Flavobacterium amniphilum TaxID=1834035 RepID=UPI00202AA1E1|nr:zincin-like metallopeptidase domain-containing protein [Flavobacterium amniphilum]MCL9806946.1 zincin-like metallopeptidase domain-containing protein [Flavobacterium amniphilum]